MGSGLYNNDLLKTAQNSMQGVNLGQNLIVSAVGLADDSVLSANKLSKLSNILYLTLLYCEKYGVTLCPDKTKLLRISKNHNTNMEVFNPIMLLYSKSLEMTYTP